MHNPWPFINTFEAKQHYKQIFGDFFFYNKYSFKKSEYN